MRTTTAGARRRAPAHRLGAAALWGILVLAFAFAIGCKRSSSDGDKARAGEKPTPAVRAAVAAAGDPVRGRALFDTFECSRCHEASWTSPVEPQKRCIGCHADIVHGKASGSTPAVTLRWVERVSPYMVAPSLEATGARLRRAWIESYLVRPFDLRPMLHQDMPRLALSAEQARDLAAFLVPDPDPSEDPAERKKALAGADANVGRELVTAKGCGTCHRMTGVPSVQPGLLPTDVESPFGDPGTMSLAPDLRYVRDRMSAGKLVAWLSAPKTVKPDTLMPDFHLKPEEAKHIAAFLLDAALAPLEKKTSPTLASIAPKPDDKRAPVLYDQVSERVFKRTCWHCHSKPDLERGDSGPGMVGGFGFKPRGLDLADYEGVFAGAVDDAGERHSIFERTKDGTPKLVASLLARHREVNEGIIDPEIRGMPLGFPPLPIEDIRLVADWIEQGRRRAHMK